MLLFFKQQLEFNKIWERHKPEEGLCENSLQIYTILLFSFV